MIERAKTFPQLKQLYISMAEEYCELVVSVATRQYSPIVKKATEYIYLNLGSSLLLKSIAEHVHVNPSHLSRKFKEETGMTITDFINKKRVDEARLHLRRGNLSVTEVAFLVGFNDLNTSVKCSKNSPMKPRHNMPRGENKNMAPELEKSHII